MPFQVRQAYLEMQQHQGSLEATQKGLRNARKRLGAAVRMRHQEPVWFVSYRGGFPPDNVAQIPQKPLSIQHNGVKGAAT
jgi:hypothetical protein